MEKKASGGFAYVLLAGILIIIVAYLVTLIPTIHNFVERGEKSKITLFSASPGKFGIVGEAERVIEFGNVKVGYVKTWETAESFDQIKVENGIFKKSFKSILINGKDVSGLKIEFNVGTTNDYGILKILVNGYVVFEKKARDGYYVINVPEKILNKNSNKIVFECTSSGLKFWAPTLYLLNNVKIDKLDYGSKSFTEGFIIYPYEVEGFKNAELSFYVSSSLRNSDLSVWINNIQVFSAPLQESPRPYQFEIKRTNFHLFAGENEINISAGNNSYYYLRNVRLTIHYYGPSQRVYATYYFNIPKPLLTDIQSGERNATIYIKISKVVMPGDLMFDFNAGKWRGKQLIDAMGIYKLPVDENAFVNGENTISISTTGSFYIDRIDLIIT